MGDAGDVVLALSYGLELMNRGAMLVTAAGHPRLANRAARDLLNKRDGLWVGPSGLQAERPTETRALLNLVRQAIDDTYDGAPQESPVTIQRKHAATSLVVRVTPGPSLASWPGTDMPTALLTVQDPEQSFNAEAALLHSLYGLTRGEAALANLLVQGRSLEEAARLLFISGHTARTHLKRIFVKTDTHRQPELVVRLLSAVV